MVCFGPLDIANVVPNSLLLSTLKEEATGSTKTLVLTRPTWSLFPEDVILIKRYEALFHVVPTNLLSDHLSSI